MRARSTTLLGMTLAVTILAVASIAEAQQDIVFMSNRTGCFDLWTTASSDPGNPANLRQVTYFNCNEAPAWPRWSPDGEWIAFNAGTGGPFAAEIFVVRSDGSEPPVQLTSFPGTGLYATKAVWGADSEWVYFIKVWPAQRSEIWRVNIWTLQLEPVNQRPNTNFQTFDISPDGALRMEMRENGCCSTPNMSTVLHDLVAGTETTVIPTDGNAEWAPRFNADATEVVLKQGPGAGLPYNLWTMNTDGSNRKQITFLTGGFEFDERPSWSADGSRILFSRFLEVDDDWDLMLYDVATESLSTLLDGPAWDFWPDWLRSVANDPPTADAGTDQLVECFGPAGTNIQLDGLLSADPEGGPLTFTWTGPFPDGGGTVSGAIPTVTLARGVHSILLTVMDDQGQTDTDEVVITVEDTLAPTIESASASPDELWPPNHRMVDVVVAVDASDACHGVACHIISVSSNEPDNGTGDGNTTEDIIITGDLTVQLRAERAGGGSGRVYTITIECADDAGNVATDTVVVAVPKSKGKKK